VNEDREYGFWEALFDFSFSKFVTVELVRILYIVAIILAALGGVASAVGAFFNYGILMGLFSAAMAVVGFVLVVLLARVWLEIFVVLFRIADYTREIAEKKD
jgi:hypothetical protein